MFYNCIDNHDLRNSRCFGSSRRRHTASAQTHRHAVLRHAPVRGAGGRAAAVHEAGPVPGPRGPLRRRRRRGHAAPGPDDGVPRRRAAGRRRLPRARRRGRRVPRRVGLHLPRQGGLRRRPRLPPAPLRGRADVLRRQRQLRVLAHERRLQVLRHPGRHAHRRRPRRGRQRRRRYLRLGLRDGRRRRLRAEQPRARRPRAQRRPQKLGHEARHLRGLGLRHDGRHHGRAGGELQLGRDALAEHGRRAVARADDPGLQRQDLRRHVGHGLQLRDGRRLRRPVGFVRRHLQRQLALRGRRRARAWTRSTNNRYCKFDNQEH